MGAFPDANDDKNNCLADGLFIPGSLPTSSCAAGGADGYRFTSRRASHRFSDGVCHHASANRPITITNRLTINVFTYNGDGARLKQLVNGTPTTYPLTSRRDSRQCWWM